MTSIKNRPRFKIRFIHHGNYIKFSALFNHPMHMGFDKLRERYINEPEYIKTVQLYINKELQTEVELSPWVSSIPVIRCSIKLFKEGTPFKLVWIDNHNQISEHQGQISFSTKS